MGLTPFAMVLEREPLQWSDLPGMLANWAQDAGGFAFAGLMIYLIVALVRRANAKEGAGGLSGVLQAALVCAGISTVLFVGGRTLNVIDWMNRPPDTRPTMAPSGAPIKLPPLPPTAMGAWGDQLVTLGGVFALIGFGIPFLRDLARLRFRRIWALARLSFKEAVRRKVLWVFLAFLLIFLFPPKWFFPIKPENEIRTYVAVIYWAMTPLLLLTAGILAAFSIPTDIRNQTIHTVVTKPVEKFEIVLGRSLGYTLLVSVVLGGLTAMSLVLLWASNPADEAKTESYKARVPVYGDLEFRGGTGDNFQGESVGREWEYRRYIAGGPRSTHRAVWVYRDPASLRTLAERDAVPCEFSFDIFRTTKGEENKGVFCTFTFVAHEWGNPLNPDQARLREYQEAVRGLNLNAQPGDADWPKLDELAEKYGFYEYRSKEVVDYHTFSIMIPGGLFRAALKGEPPRIDVPGRGPVPAPRMQVVVKCESRTQFLGVAKHDLYLLAKDGSFALNFFKGVFGLWLRLVMVIVVAVACSTYLSGVISLLAVVFLYGTGLFQDFIEELAQGQSVGGGPFEAGLRLLQNQNLTAPLPQTAGTAAATFFDQGFQWVLRRILNIIPDVDRFSWSNYVAEGFNVPGSDMLLSALVLAGYLLPWAVVAYYLMKSREVATW
jgi:ABC-type transport system involved in multi-copper enzyme maturation permease subunit